MCPSTTQNSIIFRCNKGGDPVYSIKFVLIRSEVFRALTTLATNVGRVTHIGLPPLSNWEQTKIPPKVDPYCKTRVEAVPSWWPDDERQVSCIV